MATMLSSGGLLIVFEGIDGAGKTTQARNLAKQLRAMGLSVLDSKEPTNGQYGQQLRQSAQDGRLSPEKELELFVQDRREHVRSLIAPGLEAGSVVIVDRYYFSTAAYQGARGMDFEDILRLNETFAPQPDLLFILRVDPTVGRARISARGDRANLFEGEAALAASAQIFDRITRPYVRMLDGNLPIGELEHIILYAVSQLVEQRIPRPAVPPLAVSKDVALQETERIIADDSIPAESKAQALLDRLGVRSARS